MCVNHPKLLTSEKMGSPWRVYMSLLFLVGRSIVCLVFYLVVKNVWKSLRKTISKLTNSSKSIQKHQNVPTGTHKKRLILFHRFLGEFTLFLISPPPHPSFLKKGDENSEKLGTRGTNFLKIHQGKRGEEKENTKFVEVMEFFYFNLLIINCHFN